MTKIDSYPLKTPEAGDLVLGIDVSDTTDDPAGSTALFDIEDLAGDAAVWSTIIAISDETTDLTTGAGKVTFRMPAGVTLTAVRASVGTAPVGADLIVDINEGGTSILSTKLSVDDGAKTSTTATSAAVISDTALADDAEITIDIDQIGSSTAGKGLKVTLIGTYT